MRSGAHATQLEKEGPHATTREKPSRCNEEPAHRNERSHMPQLRPDIAKNLKNNKIKFLKNFIGNTFYFKFIYIWLRWVFVAVHGLSF